MFFQRSVFVDGLVLAGEPRVRDDTTTPFSFSLFLFFLFLASFFVVKGFVLYDTGVRASLVQGGWVLGKLNLDQRA